jgi:prepilin-type N-terminal cleavage/methylation domain-containing protein
MLKKSESHRGRLQRASTAAFTLLESMVACAVIAIGLAGTYSINGQCMDVLRMAKDEASASQVIQQRIESLRIANWQRISDNVWIRDHLLNASADGSAALPGLVETVTIMPYPITTTDKNTFTRNGTTASATCTRSGTTTTASTATPDFIGQNSLVITWTVTWTGVPRNKQHKREVVTVLGKGGIAK